MRCLMIIVLLLTSHLTLAEVYKKVDKNNHTSYSDTKTKGAEEVKMPLGQHYSPINVAPIENIYEDKDIAKGEYKTVSIVQPKSEATVRNNQGLVRVDVVTDPALRERNKLIVLLYGKQMGSPQVSSSFTLTGIDRGTHTVQVIVLDPKGHELAKSAEVTFHLHRPRENMPSGPYPFPFTPAPPAPAPGP